MANEKRLTTEDERASLIRCLKMRHDAQFTPGVYEHSVIGRAALFLEETANAVEVVRCKDCKHWQCWRISGEGSGDCLLDEGYATLATQHYDFCSYGEKMDGDGNDS